MLNVFFVGVLLDPLLTNPGFVRVTEVSIGVRQKQYYINHYFRQSLKRVVIERTVPKVIIGRV